MAIVFGDRRDKVNSLGLPLKQGSLYVLGGRAMMVAYGNHELGPFVEAAFLASPGFPVLIDRYLECATEVDVDVLCDGTDVYIGGVMQHVDVVAGIHSDGSAFATPPHTLPKAIVEEIKESCHRIALAPQVKGLMNVQMAVKDGQMYIIEINPRASHTVPCVSKATGVPLARMSAKVALGKTLKQLGVIGHAEDVPWCAVKEAVPLFNRFPGAEPILMPEMKSTGEVMGINNNFELADWKSQIAAGQKLPSQGQVFVSARASDKPCMIKIGRELTELGFSLVATEVTANAPE